LGNPIARKEDGVNPPVNPDATREEAVVETNPEVDLFADSLDRFICSLIWEEPDPRKKPTPRTDG
jgi:hypothetical protein